MKRLRSWIRSLLLRRSRPQLPRDVDDELRFHVEGRIDELVDSGWSPHRAREEVLRRFGNLDRIARDCRRIAANEKLPKERGQGMESFLNDIRHTLRQMLRTPAFTAGAMITLALGIGANATMFSIANAMYMIPQRFERPDELAFLWTQTERSRRATTSGLDWLDWRAQSDSFETMGAFRSNSHILNQGGAPETIHIVEASTNLLPMLGIQAQIGRLPDASDDAHDADLVAVLTDELWQRRFGADPEAIGQTIKLDDVEHTIIGVLEPRIRSDRLWHNTSLFRPLSLDRSLYDRERGGFRSIGRLKTGVSIELAQVELSGIAARLAESYPQTNVDRRAFVQSVNDYFLPADNKFAMAGMLMSAGALLVIACVNLANFLLARATARSGEIAVRVALGASRKRILRQLLSESLVLAMIGGALGLLVSRWAIDLFNSANQFPALRASEIGLNPALLIYTVCIAAFSALGFGSAPALAAMRISVASALKDGGASVGGRPTRLRNAIVIGQLALTIPLLIACAMAARQMVFLESLDFGFDTHDMLVMQIDRPTYRYETGEQWQVFVRDVLETIEALPGVEAAGAALSVPLGANRRVHYDGELRLEGDLGAEPRPGDAMGYQVVTPSYFGTMGVSLIGGRFFTDADDLDDLQVGIVNRRLAEHYWPEEDPIGKRFTFDPTASPIDWITVVGTVADFGATFWGEPIEGQLYLPHAQKPVSAMRLITKIAGTPADVVPTITAAVHGIDPEVPLYRSQTIDTLIDIWLSESRMVTTMVGATGILALALASIGLFGMISYSVAQRTHEIGVRVALGAHRSSIMQLVIRRSLRLAAIGMAVGLVISTVVAAAMISTIHGTEAPRPATVAAVLGILLVVAVAAAYVPARRATRIDPLLALRAE